MGKLSANKHFIYAIAAALCSSFAWWDPGTILCAVLGWLGAFFIVLLARQSYRQYFSFLLFGLILYPIGFYWLYNTIADLSGFPPLLSLLAFILFCFYGAIQFLIFVFIIRNLPPFFKKTASSAATAWVITELIPIRIFPWNIGHTQLAFSPFAQIADIGGSLLLSFMVFWLIEASLQLFSKENRAWYQTLPHLLMLAALAYGYSIIAVFSPPHEEKQEPVMGKSLSVALIQGNVSLKDKHDRTLFLPNIEKYLELSKPFDKKDTLIIWPETTIMNPVSAKPEFAKLDRKIPIFENGASLLTGAISFLDRKTVFNSAIARFGNKQIPTPYHKQILVPFGEFTPFGEVFPWLRNFSASPVDFKAGSNPVVFAYPIKSEQQEYLAKVSPLVCYEDIIPEPSRAATQQGAELLVNLTNDAWYGDTVAPYQHNLIASFRALENRRYLLRVTNTGLTSIINPLGKTLSQIKPFTIDTIYSQVELLSIQTLYTKYMGKKPWWLLLIICTCVIAYRKVIKKG